MKKDKVELGDTVKDANTGFKGVAVARTEFINKCIQFSVVPKADKDNKQAEEIGIDEDSLVVVKKNKLNKPKKVVKKKVNGGAYRKGITQRGY